MEKREISEGVERRKYFEPVAAPVSERDDGTREMGELYPFLISGGSNTERYYFTHISDTTEFKFNIRPRFFGDESNYTEVFPKRINEILKANHEPVIFCVFDWDTVVENETRLKKHKAFEEQFQTEISNGMVTICPSMPNIEYWFLLHFANYTKRLKNYRESSNVLAPYIKPCFGSTAKRIGKLLKSEKYLKDASWVKNLCADGKLALAIDRAKKNIEMAVAARELDNQSYSYIYKVFEKR